MRSFTALLLANSEIQPGVHLLEVQAPQLARAAQPGQYCMVRACDSQASDPLLRRPFFVAHVEPAQDICRFLVYKRGRASMWLAHQQPGMFLDLLGPLGHGWTIRSEARNLLLIGEDSFLAALLLLASHAIERELSITLIHIVKNEEQGYPAALLPPEVEYQVFSSANEVGRLAASLSEYLAWADTVCCSLSETLLATLARANPRWREKNFAQAIIERPVLCIAGTCLACQLETRRGSRLVCRDGPVFALRDLAEGQ